MSYKTAAKEIFSSALHAVMPENIITDNLTYHDGILSIKNQHFNLSKYENVFVYGSGKASIEMAKALQSVLGDKITHTMVVANYSEKLEKIEVLESTHPLPSAASVSAGKALINAFEKMGEKDFFIYLLSGGSSALIEKPLEGVSLEDFIATTKLLLHHGLAIDEINTVRKNLSLIKGGGLACQTSADGLVLVMSDVIGDDLQAIGSAPLLKDNSSLKDVRTIINKYKLFDLLPISVQAILDSESIIRDKNPKSYPHFLVASNKIALHSAYEKAKQLGFSVKIIADDIEGDVKEVAKRIAKYVKEEQASVLLFGGEPTVEVKGDGNGGRNQELCLWMLKQIREGCNVTFLSAGTDGIDGNSDAAGAVVRASDYHDSLEKYLDNNDSYHYLKNQESLIMIGKSGTNVMDIMIAIKETKGEQ